MVSILVLVRSFCWCLFNEFRNLQQLSTDSDDVTIFSHGKHARRNDRGYIGSTRRRNMRGHPNFFL